MTQPAVLAATSDAVDDNGWRFLAACRDAGDKVDFHLDYGYVDHERQIIATWCRNCYVREACLRTALAHEQAHPVEGRHGIWGGMTGRDRAALVRKHRRQKEAAA